MIDLERVATLQNTLASQSSRLTELENRLAILECEPEQIVAEEWDEAFPYQGNENQELALSNV